MSMAKGFAAIVSKGFHLALLDGMFAADAQETEIRNSRIAPPVPATTAPRQSRGLMSNSSSYRDENSERCDSLLLRAEFLTAG